MSQLGKVPDKNGGCQAVEEMESKTGENETQPMDGETNNRRKNRRSKRKKNNEQIKRQDNKIKQHIEVWLGNLYANKEVLKKKKEDKEKRAKKQTEDKEKWWGDEATINRDWPNAQESGTIRIFGQNINGTSYKGKYSDWEMFLESTNKMQADVMCISEVNMDLNKANVRYELTQQARKMDKNIQIGYAASATTITESEKKEEVQHYWCEETGPGELQRQLKISWEDGPLLN